MYPIKEKLNFGKGLLFLSYGLIYSALAFSVVNEGSYAVWRKTLVQTLIFFSFFSYLAFRQLSGKRLLDKSPMDVRILVLLGYVAGISFFAASKAVAFNSLIQLLSCICAFYIFVSMAKKRDEQIRLIIIPTAITLVLCIYGLMIHSGIFLFPEWEYRQIIQAGMLCATFANHNHLAGWLEMALLLFAGFFFIKKRSLPVTLLMIAVFSIMMAAQIFSLSRGGWTATIGGGLFMLLTSAFGRQFHTPKMVLPITAGIVFIVLLGVLGSSPVVERSLTLVEMETDTDRLSGRALIWRGTLDMIKAHPLTGVGPGNHALMLPGFQPPGSNFRFYEAHNDYLQFTAEMGVFFIPLMLWLIIGFFKTGYKKLSHPSRQTRWITLGAMGGIVAILVHSVSDFNLQIPSNALLFTLLAAQVAAPGPALRKTR